MNRSALGSCSDGDTPIDAFDDIRVEEREEASYSGHRALDDDIRRRLLARIRRRVEARQGGQVRKTYLAVLNVAERL